MAKTSPVVTWGIKCDWIGRAATEKELHKITTIHAADEQGLKEMPKELWAKAKLLIKDECRSALSSFERVQIFNCLM